MSDDTTRKKYGIDGGEETVCRTKRSVTDEEDDDDE